MILTIGEAGTVPQDFTSKVFDTGDDVIATGERERATFQRVVSDARIRLSDLDRSFSTMITSKPATTHWRVTISHNGRTDFVGEIYMPSVLFDADQESVLFDAYSLDKLFWDAAKISWIYNTTSFTEGGILFTTLQYILERTIKRNATIMSLINGFDIDPLYATRPIRGWINATGSDAKYGNNGKFKNLAIDTTIYELLVAISFYYNAEFFINPQTLLLTMKRRGDILDDRETNIDDLLIEQNSPGIYALDSDKYDYILTAFRTPPPPAPGYISVDTSPPAGTGMFGAFKWRVTDVIQSGSLTIETVGGTESFLGDFVAGRKAVTVTMSIPKGFAGTIMRRIYRQDWLSAATGQTPVPISDYYLVGEIDNSTDTFTDGYIYGNGHTPPGGFVFLPKFGDVGNMWFGYSETLGRWIGAIENDGTTQTPQGKILDVTPKLRFHSVADNATILPFSILDVIAFFGGEKDFNLSNFVKQWLPLFLTRQAVDATFSGLDYVVGDSVISQQKLGAYTMLRSKKMAVKKAALNLNKEESRLTLVTVPA